jgi:hypothetical protein
VTLLPHVKMPAPLESLTHLHAPQVESLLINNTEESILPRKRHLATST